MRVGKIYILRTRNPEDMLVHCDAINDGYYKVSLLALRPEPEEIPKPFGGYYLVKKKGDPENSKMIKNAQLVPIEELPLYIGWPYVADKLFDFFTK